MKASQTNIIRHYCRGAAGLGVVLGPGVDAGPLALTWGAGFVHLAHDAQLDIDETEAKAVIAGIVAAFGAWFVSGKIAQAVAAALMGAGLAGAGVSAGATFLLAVVGTLFLNATINAVFTYRFLTACAALMNDNAYSDKIFLKAFANNVTHQLLTLAELPGDIVKCAKLMAGGPGEEPGAAGKGRARPARPIDIDLLSPRYSDPAAVDLLSPRYGTWPAAAHGIDLLSPRYGDAAGREARPSPILDTRLRREPPL